MSRCCFPSLSCLRSKNKIRSAAETISPPFQGIRSNVSLNRESILNTSNFAMNKSLPNIPKSSKHSITSHKSMIAIRVAERFEPQKIKFLGKKDVSIDSLSISKISDVYLSDNSCYDFFDNHVEEKKLEKKPERNNNVLERNGRSIRGFVSLNRKEATPMFVKNPCFENSSRISLSKKLNN